MRTSQDGRHLIEAFEGLYLHAYYDPVHVLTIGYGHTNLSDVEPFVCPGMVITEAEADAILAADLRSVERNVERTIKVPLKQYEFDALVSFDFNTGKLRAGTVDDKLNAGDKQAAMQTLLQYERAGGRILRGLTRRRQAEKLLFEGKIKEALTLARSKGK